MNIILLTFLLLAYPLYGVQNVSIKSLDKINDYPSSEKRTDICLGWNVTLNDVQKAFRLSEQISSGIWGYSYDHLPCAYRGKLVLDGEEYNYSMNGGGWLEIEFNTSTTRYGCSEQACQQYFLLSKVEKEWEEVHTNNILLRYPEFLTVHRGEDMITLTHDVAFKHKQYLDGRSGEVVLNTKRDFSMTLEVYDDLKTALQKHYLESYNLQDAKKNDSYIIRTGSEGVGDVYQIRRVGGKVFVLALRYNINKMTPLQKYIPSVLNFEEALKLQNEIALQIEYLE